MISDTLTYLRTFIFKTYTIKNKITLEENHLSFIFQNKNNKQTIYTALENATRIKQLKKDGDSEGLVAVWNFTNFLLHRGKLG